MTPHWDPDLESFAIVGGPCTTTVSAPGSTSTSSSDDDDEPLAAIGVAGRPRLLRRVPRSRP